LIIGHKIGVTGLTSTTCLFMTMSEKLGRELYKKYPDYAAKYTQSEIRWLS